MFSTNEILLLEIPLPLIEATNIATSSDTTTLMQQEEIERYVHRYLKLSIYEKKQNKRCSSSLFLAISFQ
jgi:hypothetical protein